MLGFHGTDKSLVDTVVNSPTPELIRSDGLFEWLGHGIYFWENDPLRALEWAQNGNSKGKITTPDAVGAVIDLGLCLDLTTRTGLEEVKETFDLLAEVYAKSGRTLPKNRSGPDKVMRELDCHVIEALHASRIDRGLPDYDSVRAPFPEDKSLFDESGFRLRNHVQICIVKPKNCIKGYFRPIKSS